MTRSLVSLIPSASEQSGVEKRDDKAFLHEVDQQWQASERNGGARLIRYADDMLLIAKTERSADWAWTTIQRQVDEMGLEINQEKSRMTTFDQGFRFLGFEFRQRRHMLYLWPHAAACKSIGQKVRDRVRSHRSSERLDEVVKRLNPVIIGWCTYFRVGNSNRVFHKIDWMIRNEICLWLRRKHRCTWRQARKRWGHRRLHSQLGLYRMVGKVSHLDDLRRTPSAEGGRRAGCGKTARPVR